MNYTQLTREQRYQIYALLKMGHNRTEIAAVIGKHKSTISRELSWNKGQRLDTRQFLAVRRWTAGHTPATLTALQARAFLLAHLSG